MIDAEFIRFGERLCFLATTLPPHVVITPAMSLGYWAALQDLTWEQFSGAVEACLKACKFMPAPVELRERAPKPRRFDYDQKDRVYGSDFVAGLLAGVDKRVLATPEQVDEMRATRERDQAAKVAARVSEERKRNAVAEGVRRRYLSMAPAAAGLAVRLDEGSE